MSLPRTAFSALLATLVGGSAWSQTPAGPEFQVNVVTAGEQRYGAIAADAAGNFVVVWASDGQDGSASGIFARRYDAGGNPRGGEFQVNTFTTDNQLFPSVASDPAGNFVVVWENFGQEMGGVAARRYDAQGNPTTPELAVNTYTAGVQAEPAAALDASGAFVVVWESYFQDGTISSIFGQRFDPAGDRLGPEFLVNTYTTGHQRNPSVAADRTGAFVVVWQTPSGNGATIVGRRYDAAGAPLGGEFGINTFPGAAGGPKVAMDANANFSVSWSRGGQDGDGSGVVARRFDCDGQPLGPDFVVNTFTTGSQDLASIAAGSGDFVVAWRSNGQDGDGAGMFGQRFRGLPACGRYHTVQPCRLADTRLPTGPSGGPPLDAGTQRNFPVGGLCSIPPDARAVAVNLTVAGPTEAGNLRLYPAGEPLPLASALNFVAGIARANNAIVRLGAGGEVGVRCDMAGAGTTHVVLDAYGYFR